MNEVGLYRNPKILKKDEIPMWDCCKIENCLRKDVGKADFFLFDSKCISFKTIEPKFGVNNLPLCLIRIDETGQTKLTNQI